MSRASAGQDDPYSFGSAFSDDAAEEPPTSPDAFSNPFAAPDTAVTMDAPSGATDPYPSYNFASTPPPPGSSARVDGVSSGTPSLDMARMGRIDAGTVAPALGVYSRGGRAGDVAVPGRTPGLDYVFAEDYKATRKKGWGEQLVYLGGLSYLTGGIVGGGIGLATAVRESAGKTGKLRLNAILNGAGKRGALFANSMGVLALTFSLSETGIYNLTEQDSVLNYAAAGAAAGAVFKSTKGPRVAAIWSLGGMAVAVGAVYASREGMYGAGLQGAL